MGAPGVLRGGVRAGTEAAGHSFGDCSSGIVVAACFQLCDNQL